MVDGGPLMCIMTVTKLSLQMEIQNFQGEMFLKCRQIFFQKNLDIHSSKSIQLINDLDRIDTGVIPNHLRDAHYVGAKTFGHGTTYKYPHNYENDYVNQQYLPDATKSKQYYVPTDNKIE